MGLSEDDLYDKIAELEVLLGRHVVALDAAFGTMNIVETATFKHDFPDAHALAQAAHEIVWHSDEN